MCGFSGFYNCAADQDFNQKYLHHQDVLNHRGPNAFGNYIAPTNSTGLFHWRLSILDLSDHANQPFVSNSKRYQMVYNGEVYNFKEIAKELGINPKTSSDTEIILEAFAIKGTDFITMLDGMFSIAIYDTLEEKLFLFRDRVGIKPLYIYHAENALFFSSEIKGLVQPLKDSLPFTVNPQAISHFLHLGYIPKEQSIYREVQKFPAGHVGVFSKSGHQIKPYWSSEEQIRSTTIKNETDALTELDQIISNAVSDRLVSDVPVGTFLSGGVDSSLVTAYAQKHHEQKIKTFSVGFSEAKFNESHFAKQVAQHLGTDHQEHLLSYTDAMERVEELPYIYDEPFADSSAIPMLLLSQVTRKEVKVALSGDGGDELFLGYGMYQWAKRLNSPLVQAFHKPLALGMSMLPNQRVQRAAKVFDFKQKKRLKSHIFSQEQYLFSENELNKLLIKGHGFLEDPTSAGKRVLSPEEEQAFFDFNNYLKDDLLVKVDGASMHHSLEVRVPLLSHHMVSFAMNVDQSLKIKEGNAKYLLKKLLARHIPQKLIDRPKWGFSIPLSTWLKTDLKYLIDQYLSKEEVESAGICNTEYVSNLVKSYINGKDYLYNRVWSLVVLHMWFKKVHHG